MIDIKGKTAELLEKELQIAPAKTMRMFDSQILSENACRRVLLVRDYQRLIKSGKTKTNIKVLLAERYFVSYSTVEKYIMQILNGAMDT